MHYCVVFFYERSLKNPFGHVDLIVLNEQGKFRFDFMHDKVPFSYFKLKIGMQTLDLPNDCTEAFVLKVDKNINKFKWVSYLFKTCSELTRIFGQIDVGMCITPGMLYNKLIKFNTKRNFTIIQRVKHGRSKSTR